MRSSDRPPPKLEVPARAPKFPLSSPITDEVPSPSWSSPGADKEQNRPFAFLPKEVRQKIEEQTAQRESRMPRSTQYLPNWKLPEVTGKNVAKPVDSSLVTSFTLQPVPKSKRHRASRTGEIRGEFVDLNDLQVLSKSREKERTADGSHNPFKRSNLLLSPSASDEDSCSPSVYDAKTEPTTTKHVFLGLLGDPNDLSVPVTPSIIVTPADEEAPWNSRRTGRNRDRVTSSIYSQATPPESQVDLNIPPVPTIPAEHGGIKNGDPEKTDVPSVGRRNQLPLSKYNWDDASLPPSPQTKEQIITVEPDSEGDRPASQGWWTYLLTPVHSTKSPTSPSFIPHSPSTPSTLSTISSPVSKHFSDRQKESSCFSPNTTVTPGFSTTFERRRRYGVPSFCPSTPELGVSMDEKAFGFSQRSKGGKSKQNQIQERYQSPPPAYGSDFSSKRKNTMSFVFDNGHTIEGEAAEYYQACAHELFSRTPYFQCINHICSITPVNMAIPAGADGNRSVELPSSGFPHAHDDLAKLGKPTRKPSSALSNQTKLSKTGALHLNTDSPRPRIGGPPKGPSAYAVRAEEVFSESPVSACSWETSSVPDDGKTAATAQSYGKPVPAVAPAPISEPSQAPGKSPSQRKANVPSMVINAYYESLQQQQNNPQSIHTQGRAPNEQQAKEQRAKNEIGQPPKILLPPESQSKDLLKPEWPWGQEGQRELRHSKDMFNGLAMASDKNGPHKPAAGTRPSPPTAQRPAAGTRAPPPTAQRPAAGTRPSAPTAQRPAAGTRAPPPTAQRPAAGTRPSPSTAQTAPKQFLQVPSEAAGTRPSPSTAQKAPQQFLQVPSGPQTNLLGPPDNTERHSVWPFVQNDSQPPKAPQGQAEDEKRQSAWPFVQDNLPSSKGPHEPTGNQQRQSVWPTVKNNLPLSTAPPKPHGNQQRESAWPSALPSSTAPQKPPMPQPVPNNPRMNNQQRQQFNKQKPQVQNHPMGFGVPSRQQRMAGETAHTRGQSQGSQNVGPGFQRMPGQTAHTRGQSQGSQHVSPGFRRATGEAAHTRGQSQSSQHASSWFRRMTGEKSHTRGQSQDSQHVSPGFRRAAGGPGSIPMSDMSTPAPAYTKDARAFSGPPQWTPAARNQQTRPNNTTVVNPNATIGRHEANRRRLEEEDLIGSSSVCGLGGIFRNSGSSRRESQTRRRWYVLICLLVFIIVIAAIVLAVTLTKKRTSAAVQSQWVNLTGYPPMPTGIATIAGSEPQLEKSTCINPSSMWSCALPKSQQDANEPYDSNMPNFRVEISFHNGTYNSSTNLSGSTGTRRVKREDQVNPSPAAPSVSDQSFMGEYTDNNTMPYAGEETPFYMSILRPLSLASTNIHRRSVDSNDTNFPNISSFIPKPVKDSDGLAAAAMLYPLTSVQPIRLYNRGKSNEHYGFYSYFDKSIFLSSQTDIKSVDTDGGTTRDKAKYRCTWAQTRFLVQIWTQGKRMNRQLLPQRNITATHTASATTPTSTSTTSTSSPSIKDFSQPGSFPYPVTITIDRHGGAEKTKMVYCYPLINNGHYNTTGAQLQVEDRSVGGDLINPAAGLFKGYSKTTNEDTKKNYGGVDGGSGGCGCQWTNWIATL